MENRRVESGIELFSRINSSNSEKLKGINPKLFFDGGPSGNQVLEIILDQDFKYVDLFIDLIVRAILPAKFHKEFKGIQVILLNTDFQIGFLKIIKYIEKKLDLCEVRSEKRTVIEETLKNLVILNCYTYEQFEITIFNLERIINNCKNPGLIVLDNVLSQYWCVKFKNPKLSFDEHCMKTLELVYHQIKHLNMVLMYGRPSYTDEKKGFQEGYSMEVTKNNSKCFVKTSNLGQHECVMVPFNFINGCLEFT